jgi:hypothetical protein
MVVMIRLLQGSLLQQNKIIFIFYFNLLPSVKVLVNVGPFVRTEYFVTFGIQEDGQR